MDGGHRSSNKEDVKEMSNTYTEQVLRRLWPLEIEEPHANNALTDEKQDIYDHWVDMQVIYMCEH